MSQKNYEDIDKRLLKVSIDTPKYLIELVDLTEVWVNKIYCSKKTLLNLAFIGAESEFEFQGDHFRIAFYNYMLGCKVSVYINGDLEATKHITPFS